MSAEFRKTQPTAGCMVDPDWKARGLCVPVLNASPELFDRLWGFSEETERDFTRAGKRICAECPVRAECLVDAILARSEGGISGGFSTTDRRAAARDLESHGVMVRDDEVSQATRMREAVAWIKTHPSFYDGVEHLATLVRRRQTRAKQQPHRSVKRRVPRPRFASSSRTVVPSGMSPLF